MDLWAPTPLPKKRTSRACDVCRRKKIRCDGAEKPDNRCSGCVSHNIECTYETHTARSNSGNQAGSLEERLLEMESKLKMVDVYPNNLNDVYPNTRRVITNTDEELEQYGIPELTKGIENVDIAEGSFLHHYHGRTSGFSYYMMAKIMNRNKRNSTEHLQNPATWKYRRERFWVDREKKRPLPKKFTRPSDASFPSEDLGRRLLAQFFTTHNMMNYMLDRADVEQRYAHGEHHRDDNFAALIFTIFAIASKWLVRDEGLSPLGTDKEGHVNGTGKNAGVLKDPQDRYSAGEAYADIIFPYYRMFQGPVSLEEFQGMTLFGFYLQITGSVHPAWVVSGVTMRLALDVGAHRRRPEVHTRVAEFWKRTFWCAFLADVMGSCTLGRIPACSWNDVDLEMPAPLAGDHLTVEFTTHVIRLVKIMDGMLRYLYPVKRPELLTRTLGEEYEMTVVAELDSALNEWFEMIPENLKWDPEMTNLADLEHSAQLYSVGYNVAQLIHRPFIPTPESKSKLPFPSLVICINAARSCANVLDVARKKRFYLMPTSTVSAFASAVTLLIASWAAHDNGDRRNYTRHIADVDKCLRYMMMGEDVYYVCGKHVDIIRELASFGGVELSTAIDSPPSLKRHREYDDDGGREARPHSDSSHSTPLTPTFASPSSPASASASTGISIEKSLSFHPPSSLLPLNEPVLCPNQGGKNTDGLNGEQPDPSILWDESTLAAFLSQQHPTPPSSVPLPHSVPLSSQSSQSVSQSHLHSQSQPQLMSSGAQGHASLMPSGSSEPALVLGQLGSGHEYPSLGNIPPGGGGGMINSFHDPNLWPAPTLGQPYSMPGGVEGAAMNQESLGLWSFAPPTFEWERWGSMIDTMKYAGDSEPPNLPY